jgi:MoxR-like ATPase
MPRWRVPFRIKEVELQVAEATREDAQSIADNIKKVIIGKDRPVELAVVALMCQGHVLIEDVPGVGKTMLARSLARSTSCTYRRIQFTPDLLPSDITGVSMFNQKTSDFEFRPGPIVAQLVLADEINRATPKTQSALLEAMDERQVTVEGITHPLPRPFIVMATQNPIEYEGTFPLPEAQLDRFFLKITLGYPTLDQEMAIVSSQEEAHPIDGLSPVASAEGIVRLQESVKTVHVDELIRQYLVTLVQATRDHSDISLGSSPRGSLTLFRGSQALALIRGRDYVLPDDVKELAGPMLAHRIIASAAARMRGVSSEDIVNALVDETPVPGAQSRGWFRT